jgi:hypothetical protein
MASVGLEWYKTGTVNVTQGSLAVTGVGTHWAVAGVKAGDMFTMDDTRNYEVATVASDTSLTLAKPYQGASGSAQNYAIIRNWAATMTAELAARVAELVNKYESYIDAELNQIVGPKGDPEWSYKGTWAAGRAYNAMDIAVYNSALYIALSSHSSTSANAPGANGAPWISLGLSIQNASETVPGVIELATAAEAQTGTDTARAMTPATMRAAIDTTPIGNLATIFVNPGTADIGDRYAAFSSSGISALGGKTPLYEIYGTNTTQYYFVSTRRDSGTRITQEAKILDSNMRRFKRIKIGSLWSKWIEQPSLRYVPVATSLLVDGENGDDEEGNGSANAPVKTIAHAIALAPKITTGWRTNITIKAGTYQMNSREQSLEEFMGGRIVLASDSGSRDVEIVFSDNGSGGRGFLFARNSEAELSSLRIVKGAGERVDYGVTIQSTNTDINNCEFENFDVAINVITGVSRITTCNYLNCRVGVCANQCGYVMHYNGAGAGNSYGLWANGGTIIKNGPQPAGSVANQLISYGQII